MSEISKSPKKSASPAKSMRGEELKVRHAPSVSSGASSTWSPGAVAIVIAAGFGLGGLGGYLMGHPADAVTASKDSSSASAAAPQGKAAAPGGNQQQVQGQKGQPPAAPPQPGAYIPLAAWTPKEGPDNAKVTIIEFSDFQ
ncbi:MAG: hypothetical protein IPM79_39025 [Polyangiaceae bacterium]|jgi:protein-disulfide isomerase|nr:hypothetical protein [Polyangiaceae bacterium]MBK8943437.1 hypothetical protein [Polyangiaceae bacterium]